MPCNCKGNKSMISEMPALKFNIVEIWTAVIRDIHYKKKKQV